MSKTARRALKLARIERTIARAVTEAQIELVGREAILNRRWPSSGKWFGRAGIITAVMPCDTGISALLMILSADGKRYLNSAPATRTYWPLADLKLTGRRVFEYRNRSNLET